MLRSSVREARALAGLGEPTAQHPAVAHRASTRSSSCPWSSKPTSTRACEPASLRARIRRIAARDDRVDHDFTRSKCGSRILARRSAQQQPEHVQRSPFSGTPRRARLSASVRKLLRRAAIRPDAPKAHTSRPRRSRIHRQNRSSVNDPGAIARPTHRLKNDNVSPPTSSTTSRRSSGTTTQTDAERRTLNPGKSQGRRRKTDGYARTKPIAKTAYPSTAPKKARPVATGAWSDSSRTDRKSPVRETVRRVREPGAQMPGTASPRSGRHARLPPSTCGRGRACGHPSATDRASSEQGSGSRARPRTA